MISRHSWGRACVFYYDGDGKPDLFLPDNGPQGGMALYHNLGDGRFEDVTRKPDWYPTLHAIGVLPVTTTTTVGLTWP